MLLLISCSKVARKCKSLPETTICVLVFLAWVMNSVSLTTNGYLDYNATNAVRLYLQVANVLSQKQSQTTIYAKNAWRVKNALIFSS